MAIFAVVVTSIALLLLILVTVALFIWARRVADWHPVRVWRGLRFLPLAAFGATLLGNGISVVLLTSSFKEVGQLPPEEKAARLSEAINTSMQPAYLMLVVGALLYGASFCACLWGTVRRPQPPAAEPR